MPDDDDDDDIIIIGGDSVGDALAAALQSGLAPDSAAFKDVLIQEMKARSDD